MRLLSLARAAIEAEGLHLRRQARMRGVQVALAAAAMIFAVLLLVMLHLAAFAALRPGWGPAGAALALAGVDLVIALVLVLAARRAGQDRIAEEARQLRQEAVRQIGDGAARAMVLAPLLRGRNARTGLMGVAVTVLLLGWLSRR
jgi:membrane protein implicated in regulation of membrane protease activity